MGTISEKKQYQYIVSMNATRYNGTEMRLYCRVGLTIAFSIEEARKSFEEFCTQILYPIEKDFINHLVTIASLSDLSSQIIKEDSSESFIKCVCGGILSVKDTHLLK